ELRRIGGEKLRLGPRLPDAFFIPPNLVRRPLFAAHVAAQMPRAHEPDLIFLADAKRATDLLRRFLLQCNRLGGRGSRRAGISCVVAVNRSDRKERRQPEQARRGVSQTKCRMPRHEEKCSASNDCDGGKRRALARRTIPNWRQATVTFSRLLRLSASQHRAAKRQRRTPA